MNMELFRVINGMAGKNALLDLIMLFLSKYMIFVFASTLALIFIFGFINNKIDQRKLAINTAIFTLINLGLAALIGAVFYVNRPFVHNKVNLLYPHVKDSSFPSDHATATSSIALGLWKGERAISIVLMFLSLAVGFSRVYVGHHTPADVIGSYVIVFIMNIIYNHLLRERVGNIYEKLEKYVIKKLRPIKDSRG
jgi:undecaprenyl-diphosphatase